MRFSHLTRSLRSLSLASPLALLLLALSPMPQAAMTDLTDGPLASTTTAQIKPNILLTLDDSGSMAWEYIPDDVGGTANQVGFRNFACNLIYYNPATTYQIPTLGTVLVNSSSTASPPAPTTFTRAYNDGFYSFYTTSVYTTNLSTSFKSQGNDTAQAAYYWKYLGSTTLTPLAGDCSIPLTGNGDNTTLEICTDHSLQTTSCAAASKTALWRKIIVSATSGPGGTDERLNFANWYSYSRYRMNMMKTAAGLAFNGITSDYRVGFITIHPETSSSDPTVSASHFLPVSDYNSTQKSAWFNKLYSQTPGGGTPLREALSLAGRYFAGKTDGANAGMGADPVQYSCQQNFEILTTDGYWNGTTGYKLDGTTAMDNEDGNLSELDAYNAVGSQFAVSPRPIYDGATSLFAWNTASLSYRVLASGGRRGTVCTYSQDQYRTSQTTQSTSQVSQTTVTTTDARAVMFITSVSSTNSVTNVTVGSPGGTTAFSGSVSGSGGNNSARRSDLATKLVGATWSNGYTPVTGTGAVGSCTGTNLPISGCTSGASYITLVAKGLGNVTATPTFTATGVTATFQAFSGGAAGSATSGPTPVASCTTGTTFSGTNTTTVTSCTTNTTGPTLVASCTPAAAAAGNSYTATTCSTTTSAWANITTCTPDPATAANSYTATTCQTLSGAGDKLQYQATVYTQNFLAPGGPGVAGSQVGPTTSSTGSWTDVPPGTCAIPGTLSAPATATVVGAGPPTPPPNCTSGSQIWPCETAGASVGGSSNSLADVAQYYWKTDLRTSSLGNCTGALGVGTDVCANNVRTSGTGPEDDKAPWQHMTTFTMGLGVPGTLTYDPNYKTQSTGAFASLRTGAINWPSPVHDDPTALDDLWHAAVNGRGQYFSAANPTTVTQALGNALATIQSVSGSAAAGATSSQQPVAGDNYFFIASFRTLKWDGQLDAYTIDVTTGALSTSPAWSTQLALDAKTGNLCDNRTIKLFRSGATNNLTDFTWNTKACDATMAPTGSATTGLNATEQAYFGATQIAALAQYPTMDASQRTNAAGANLVNFLRGQRGYEGFVASSSTLYRSRDHVLGDLMNAAPIYVRGPIADYADTGYGAFKTAIASRAAMVYSAGNDGMLHAFYADATISTAGNEAWAFMPSMVLPNLYKLANSNYSTNHISLVDATPAVGDVFDPSPTAIGPGCTATLAAPGCWKTILVGGLRKGGQGFYALDISDPANPKGLWEFKWSTLCYSYPTVTTTDCNLGYSYATPVIAKLANGTWVVIVTSGYNNVSSPPSTGDGVGYLYVLNAMTGEIMRDLDANPLTTTPGKISTGVGSTTTPSGLTKIDAWFDDGYHDRTAKRVYGGDLLGNLWRFDINDTLAPSGVEATLLATVTDSSGTPQPITVTPLLSEVGGAPYVYLGTGRLLGTTDTANTQSQSIWAFRDPLTAPTPPATSVYPTPRSTLAQNTFTQTGTGITATRTIACSNNCGATVGWFVDLPESGERVNIDLAIAGTTVAVVSNVPESNACTVGGHSWIDLLNSANGLSSGGTVVAVHLTYGGVESLGVGISYYFINGTGIGVVPGGGGNSSGGGGGVATFGFPGTISPSTGKHVTWRELLQ